MTPKKKKAAPESGTDKRRDERDAARQSRRTSGRAPDISSGDKSLARDFKQGAGGRMNGSAAGKNGLPTVRQATGLTRLGCPWCRSSGMRPLFIGAGQIKTVIAVQPCNHRWSSRDNGPSQKPAGPRDQFLCPPCGNTGQQTVTTTRHADGAVTRAKIRCLTCQGWIVHW